MKRKVLILLGFALGLGTSYTYAQEHNEDVKQLEEVIIQSKTPYLKLKDGRISFNPKTILQERAISNALDILKYIPGLSLMDGTPKLSGIHPATILLNGYNTQASTEQLLAYLQSLDPRTIKAVELMLIAPASTGVKGSAINVVIDPTLVEQGITALISSTGEIGRYKAGKIRGGINTVSSKWHNNLSLSLESAQSGSQTLTNNKHYLEGQGIIPIQQDVLTDIDNKLYTLQLNSDYKIDEHNSLSFLGYLTGVKRESFNKGQVVAPGAIHQTGVATDAKERLYHLSLGYRNPKISNIDLSYAHYSGARDALTKDQAGQASGSLSLFSSNALQSYRNLAYNISRDSKLSDKLSLSYGIFGSYTKVSNENHIWSTGNPSNEKYLIKNKEEEHNIHSTLSYAINDRTNLGIGATLSYFNRSATPLSEGLRDKRILPNLQLSYAINKDHILALSLTSKRGYPSYDELSNIVLSRNAYSVYQGNPFLQPTTSYVGNLQYIFLQKYSLSLWASRSDGAKVVMPYQHPDALRSVIRPVNLDRQHQVGLTLSTNTNIKGVPGLSLSGNISAIYLQQRLAGYYDLDINKQKVFLVGDVRLEYAIPGVKDLRMGLDVFANTASIQGIYQIKSMWRVDPWIKYTFWGGRATLRIKCVDLFNTYRPRTVIEEIRQHEEMKQWNFLRKVDFELEFRIGKRKYRERPLKLNTERYMQVKNNK